MFLKARGIGGDVGVAVGGALNECINKAAPTSVSLLPSVERNQPIISDSRSITDSDSDFIPEDKRVERVEIQVPLTGNTCCTCTCTYYTCTCSS